MNISQAVIKLSNLKIILQLLLCLCLTSCASTSSVKIDSALMGDPVIAVLSLEGELGEQAADFITQQLAINGIAPIERSQINAVLTEHGFRNNSAFDVSSFAEYGKLLGVKKIFIGTISTVDGPLYSYPHVNMSLKLVDVETGRIVWIGKYGNSMWSSAISTQGDIQRGATHIVKEFIKVYGKDF